MKKRYLFPNPEEMLNFCYFLFFIFSTICLEICCSWIGGENWNSNMLSGVWNVRVNPF
jgi:hypothetical protein